MCMLWYFLFVIDLTGKPQGWRHCSWTSSWSHRCPTDCHLAARVEASKQEVPWSDKEIRPAYIYIHHIYTYDHVPIYISTQMYWTMLKHLKLFETVSTCIEVGTSFDPDRTWPVSLKSLQLFGSLDPWISYLHHIVHENCFGCTIHFLDFSGSFFIAWNLYRMPQWSGWVWHPCAWAAAWVRLPSLSWSERHVTSNRAATVTCPAILRSGHVCNDQY